MTIIYKIVPEALWRADKAEGRFIGASIDLQDGYIHLSTAGQARETAARYFSGMDGLLLAAIDGDALGDALKWEPSRGGALFPHLYGPLDFAHVLWAEPLPIDASGAHIFPARFS
jgi:uncharacterized protein (DUF952 family)